MILGMIPVRCYRFIEGKLHSRADIRKRAENEIAQLESAWAGATGTQAPALGNSTGGGKSGRHDRLEQSVIRLMEARERCGEDAQWVLVFNTLDAEWPEGTLMRDITDMLYDQHLRQTDVINQLGVSRRTVRGRRDAYVIRAAMLASAAGLIGEELLHD